MEQNATLLDGGRTSDTLEDMGAVLEHAAEVLNGAFAHIASRTLRGLSFINEAHLIARIGRVVTDTSLAVTIVEMLRSRGSIVPDNKARALVHALHCLRADGVLHFNPAIGAYEPTERYRHAANHLRNRRDPLLPVRWRKPPPLARPQPTQAPPETPATVARPLPPRRPPRRSTPS